MDSNEDFFKRKEDREWREKVDHEQVTLMTGHQVLGKQLEDLDEKLDQLDNLLRGDPVKETGGIIEQLHDLHTAVSKLSAAVFMDSTGKLGLVHDVDVLMGRRSDREKSAARMWTFWTAVATAAISSGALLLTKWDVVSKFFKPGQPDKVEQMIENVKHPKSKHRHVVIHEEEGD